MSPAERALHILHIGGRRTVTEALGRNQLLSGHAVSVVSALREPKALIDAAKLKWDVVHIHDLESLAIVEEQTGELISTPASVVLSVTDEREATGMRELGRALRLLDSGKIKHLLLGCPALYPRFGRVPSWSWLMAPIDLELVSLRPPVEPEAHKLAVSYLNDKALGAEQIEGVLSAVEAAGLRFVVKPIEYDEAKPIRELRKQFKSVDLFIDSLDSIFYSTYAVEAMAHGIAVLGVNPAEFRSYYTPLTMSQVQPTTGATCKEILSKIVREPRCIRDLGPRSRRYVETCHQAGPLAAEVLDLYQRILA